MRTYKDLCGGSAPLNTIVMAGSHDAGITGGRGYARTQDLSIYEQAQHGVRLFDLRIAVAATGNTLGGTKIAEMRAYHADGIAKKQETKTRFLADTGKTASLERSSIRAGAFGETLQKMLQESKVFVRENATEFLILKFDKCLNWALIAEACVKLLGDAIYKLGGNLNLKTIDQLAGKVIVVFTKDGQKEAAAAGYGPAQGICGIRNCNGESYTDQFDGIQYFGKGGTSIMGLRPVTENKLKQRGLMVDGIQSHPQALGMMYWTSTGLLGNIKSRNKRMWTSTNNAALQKTWRHGLSQSIDNRLGKNTLGAGGTMLKTFMPNIVMIDFADDFKCETIMNLNLVAANDLKQLVMADEKDFASEEV